MSKKKSLSALHQLKNQVNEAKNDAKSAKEFCEKLAREKVELAQEMSRREQESKKRNEILEQMQKKLVQEKFPPDSPHQRSVSNMEKPSEISSDKILSDEISRLKNQLNLLQTEKDTHSGKALSAIKTLKDELSRSKIENGKLRKLAVQLRDENKKIKTLANSNIGSEGKKNVPPSDQAGKPGDRLLEKYKKSEEKLQQQIQSLTSENTSLKKSLELSEKKCGKTKARIIHTTSTI